MTKYEFMIYRVTNVSEIEHGKISGTQSPISGVNIVEQNYSVISQHAV